MSPSPNRFVGTQPQEAALLTDAGSKREGITIHRYSHPRFVPRRTPLAKRLAHRAGLLLFRLRHGHPRYVNVYEEWPLA